MDVARLSQHLVDFAQVLLLIEDHSARVLLEHHRLALHEGEQLVVEREALRLVLNRLAQDVAALVLAGLEQGVDCERRIGAEGR